MFACLFNTYVFWDQWDTGQSLKSCHGLHLFQTRAFKGGCVSSPSLESRRVTLTGNGECLQYAAVSMRQRPSPRRSPPTVPSRGSSRREKPAPLQRDGEMMAGGERRPKTAEEKSSLVYAALNHQPLEAAASSRPRRPKEENSEYAAIRVS